MRQDSEILKDKLTLQIKKFGNCLEWLLF
jgi:hypothetical protein